MTEPNAGTAARGQARAGLALIPALILAVAAATLVLTLSAAQAPA